MPQYDRAPDPCPQRLPDVPSQPSSQVDGPRRRTLGALLGSAALGSAGLTAGAPDAAAQASFPSKPIRLITPYPPGGATDTLSRFLAPRLGELLGQPIVVEARAGGGGNVGTDLVAKSPPDGHTLAMSASGPLAINVSLFRGRLPYDPRRDLTPVCLVAAVPLVVIANPANPWATLADLTRELKARPGRLSYASAGNGTPQHLSAELFKQLTGTFMVHIPYRGSGPAMNDVLGNQVPVSFENLGVALPQIKAGKLRALAVTSRARHPQLPDVPTVAETGVANYESLAWYGIVGPAGLPAPVLEKLNDAIRRTMATPDVREKLAGFGTADVSGPPAQFAAFIRSEIDKWTPIVARSGATID